MFLLEQKVPLNNEGLQKKKLLGILIMVDILFILAKIMFMQIDSIISIIGLGLMILSYLTCHYQAVTLLIFVLIFDFCMTVIFIMFRIQNSLTNVHDKFLEQHYYIIIVVIQVLSLGFQLYATTLCFEIYQVFKQIYLLNENYHEVEVDEDLSQNDKPNV